MRKKKIEKTHAKETITCTRQYLHGSAICLRPRSCRDFTIIKEEYRVQDVATIFSLYIKNTATTQHKTLKPESRFHKNGLNGSQKKISRGRCPRTPRGLSMSALAGRNGNGLGTGRVSLYPNPTRGFDSEARTRPVY